VNTDFDMEITEKQFEILEVIHLLGPCSAEEVLRELNGSDLLEIMRSLYDLTNKGLLLRPEVDEQVLYEVNGDYDTVRVQLFGERLASLEV
jgi:hypothetical protein